MSANRRRRHPDQLRPSAAVIMALSSWASFFSTTEETRNPRGHSNETSKLSHSKMRSLFIWKSDAKSLAFTGATKCNDYTTSLIAGRRRLGRPAGIRRTRIDCANERLLDPPTIQRSYRVRGPLQWPVICVCPKGVDGRRNGRR